MEKVLLYFSCGLAVVADMLLVWWAKNSNHPLWCIIIGIILLNISVLIWSYSMYVGTQSIMAITTYSLLTIIGCSFLGYVIFHENLTTINAIGLILALIALILINL